jgi:hypothetical protein
MDHRAVVNAGDGAHPDGQFLAGPSRGLRPLEGGVQPSPSVVGRRHLDQGAMGCGSGRTWMPGRVGRTVATRDDEREFVYRGTIDVASIRIWLRDPPETYSRDAA